MATATANDTEESTGRKRKDAKALELAALKERIELARDVKPEGKDLHCEDCFQRGRDAAIRTITAKE